MMDTALYLFGMKLYKQEGSIEFFDADFMNAIKIKSDQFQGMSLRHCCNMINEFLTSHEYKGKLFTIPKLTSLDDFDLGNVNVGEGAAIMLRMNSFTETLEVKKVFSQFESSLICNISYDPMPPNYYDSKLCSVFESCLRNKFEGL